MGTRIAWEWTCSDLWMLGKCLGYILANKKNAIFYITAIYLILKWDGKASSERIDFFSKCF